MSLALPIDALSALAQAGELPSLFNNQPVLCVDLAAGERGGELSQVCAWLRRAACPIFGIGPVSAAPQLASVCDVVLDDLDVSRSLIERARAAPIAAAVFVQLLRQTEYLELEPALFAESLAYASLQAGPEYQTWLRVNRAPTARKPSETTPAVELRVEHGRWRLSLDRASTQNAMSLEMRDALMTALAQVAAAPQPRGLIIDARGATFSTGGELSEFGQVPDAPTGHLVRQIALPGRALVAVAAQTVVRVHGACIGSGIEFPAFAQRIEARADARFSLPELSFGLIPGAGGCVSIPRRIGRQRMAAWVLSGAQIDAQTALDWGLVDAVVSAWDD